MHPDAFNSLCDIESDSSKGLFLKTEDKWWDASDVILFELNLTTFKELMDCNAVAIVIIPQLLKLFCETSISDNFILLVSIKDISSAADDSMALLCKSSTCNAVLTLFFSACDILMAWYESCLHLNLTL